MRTIRHIAIAAGVATVFLPMTFASAATTNLGTAGDITYLTNSTLVPAGSAGTVSVSCPGTTHVVGGGVDAGNTDPTTRINSIYPFDGPDLRTNPDDGITVRVFNGSTSASTVAAYAECSTVKPEYIIGSKAVPSHTVLVARAHCDSGFHVVGGGEQSAGNIGAMKLASTSPSDDSSDTDTKPDNVWRTVTYNRSGSTHTVTYFGICWTHAVTYNVTTLGSSDTSPQTVSCPNSSHLTSGGIRWDGNDALFAPLEIAPADDGSDGDSVPDDGALIAWRNNDTANLTPSVFAVCEPA